MTEYRVCLVMVPDREIAVKIAHEMVSSKLSACTNIVPGLESIYRWQGKIEHTGELLLLIKTRQELVEAVDKKLRELHPYSVYEFVVLPVETGNEKYLAWLHESTS